jgi:carboxymethylenebutenolidase
VVASYGGLDTMFARQAPRLERYLESLGVPHDVKIYDGAGHSFLSYDNVPTWMARLPSPMHVGYDEAAAEDAWSRILGFFHEHL